VSDIEYMSVIQATAAFVRFLLLYLTLAIGLGAVMLGVWKGNRWLWERFGSHPTTARL